MCHAGRLQRSGFVNIYERVREEALVTGKGWTAMESQSRSHTITKETQELSWPFKDVPSWGQTFASPHQPIIGWRLSSGKGHTFRCRSLGRLLKRDTYVKCRNCCKRYLQMEEDTVWFLSFFLFFSNLLGCVLWTRMWSILLNIPCELVKNAYSAVVGWSNL